MVNHWEIVHSVLRTTANETNKSFTTFSEVVLNIIGTRCLVLRAVIVLLLARIYLFIFCGQVDLMHKKKKITRIRVPVHIPSSLISSEKIALVTCSCNLACYNDTQWLCMIKGWIFTLLAAFQTCRCSLARDGQRTGEKQGGQYPLKHPFCILRAYAGYPVCYPCSQGTETVLGISSRAEQTSASHHGLSIC